MTSSSDLSGSPAYTRGLTEERVDRVVVLAQEPELRDLAVAEVTDEGVVRVQGFIAALEVRPLKDDSVLVVGQVRVRLERVLRARAP